MQTESETVRIPLEITRTGRPAVWESGGGYSNTGSAIIFTDQDGCPPRAIYIKRKGHLACENHALIPFALVGWVIKAKHHRGDFEIKIIARDFERAVNLDERVAFGKLMYSYSDGEWYPHRPPGFLWEALMAAKKKATTYHCRTPMFVSQDSF